MIQSQLEKFDQQIKEIDQQIQEATLQKMNDVSEKPAAKTKSNKPKTKQDIQNDILSNITAASAELDRAESISSQKNRIDGKAGVLQSEIELDKARDSTGSGAKAIAKKEELVSEMQSRSQGLLQNIGEKLHETKEILEENAELSATKPVDDDKHSQTVDGAGSKWTVEDADSQTDLRFRGHLGETGAKQTENVNEAQDKS